MISFVDLPSMPNVCSQSRSGTNAVRARNLQPMYLAGLTKTFTRPSYTGMLFSSAALSEILTVSPRAYFCLSALAVKVSFLSSYSS